MMTSHTLVAGVYTPQYYELNPRQQLPLQLDQQGNLKVTSATADGPVDPGTAASNSQLAGGVYNSNDVSLSSGQQAALQLDARGYLKTTLADTNSEVSTANSTSTALNANGVFTGTSEEVKDIASIVIQVYSSHASAANGLQIQFSTNNSNWDKVVLYNVAATTPINLVEFPRARYYRVVYTNGATLQTAFRLQTIFHYSPVNLRHTTFDTALNAYETCVLTRSALVGFDPTTNVPYNAKVNSAGQLLVATAGASGPSTTEATESFSKRAYQTTVTIQLPTITEYNMIYFKNPAGSGKTIYVRNITFANTTGANKTVTLKVYSNPTVSVAGTTLTPTSMYVGGAAANTVTAVTYNNIGLHGHDVTQTMTVTNNGTVLSIMVATHETSNIDYNWGLIVAADNSLLVNGIASGNNQNITINIIWSEV
jgi:hypothetical protein